MRLKVLAGAVVLAVVGTSMAASAATTAPEHGYVMSRVVVPLSPSSASALGRDIDGDGNNDNQLGQVLTALSQQGLDLGQAWNSDISSGAIVMLQSLRTRSLATDRQATWQAWYGVPVADPDLTGTGTFTAGSTHSALLPAKLVDHRLTTSPGRIPIRMDIGSGPFTMPLALGRVFATCYAKCASGRINGAFRATDISATFYPKLAQVAQAAIDRDCTGPAPGTCADGSQGAAYEGLLDANQDLVVTTYEVRTNNLIKALFAPDLDLFKSDGTPGRNGVKDSLSFGFGFTAVKATIVH